MEPHELDAAAAATLCHGALVQMDFARRYTLELLGNTPRELWCERPVGSKSTILWQIGHLTVSQYGLMLFRQRGRAEGDLDLIPGWFRKQFGRGSDPTAEMKAQPSAEDMLQRLETVHAQSMAELRDGPTERLLEPTEMPYVGYPMKIGAVLFAPMHEMIHVGQIGALRRALGLEPIR